MRQWFVCLPLIPNGHLYLSAFYLEMSLHLAAAWHGAWLPPISQDLLENNQRGAPHGATEATASRQQRDGEEVLEHLLASHGRFCCRVPPEGCSIKRVFILDLVKVFVLDLN